MRGPEIWTAPRSTKHNGAPAPRGLGDFQAGGDAPVPRGYTGHLNFRPRRAPCQEWAARAADNRREGGRVVGANTFLAKSAPRRSLTARRRPLDVQRPCRL